MALVTGEVGREGPSESLTTLEFAWRSEGSGMFRI